MKIKEPKIIPKTREEIELEITEILENKGKHKHGAKLRQAAKVLSIYKTREEIRQLFIEEYVKKYGELSSGKTTIKKMQEEIKLPKTNK